MAAQTIDSKYVDDHAGVLVTLLDSPEITRLIGEVVALNWTGQKGYGARGLIGACLVKSLYAIPVWSRVAALIAEHRALADAIGGTPSQWACYRFARKLRENPFGLDIPIILLDLQAKRAVVPVVASAEAQQRWVVAKQAEIDRAVNLSEELAALVADQERDERSGHRVFHGWVQSLDACLADGGSELHELVASDASDPAALYEQSEFAALVNRVTGGRTEEDIARLDYRTQEWLATKLREEGLAAVPVLASERERLRPENRHAGGSVPKTGRRHGGKRTRAQQSQVTRDHHVRELDNASKKAHRQRRRQRQRMAA